MNKNLGIHSNIVFKSQEISKKSIVKKKVLDLILQLTLNSNKKLVLMTI